jgi:hypothetical protein
MVSTLLYFVYSRMFRKHPANCNVYIFMYCCMDVDLRIIQNAWLCVSFKAHGSAYHSQHVALRIIHNTWLCVSYSFMMCKGVNFIDNHLWLALLMAFGGMCLSSQIAHKWSFYTCIMMAALLVHTWYKISRWRGKFEHPFVLPAQHSIR